MRPNRPRPAVCAEATTVVPSGAPRSASAAADVVGRTGFGEKVERLAETSAPRALAAQRATPDRRAADQTFRQRRDLVTHAACDLRLELEAEVAAGAECVSAPTET